MLGEHLAFGKKCDLKVAKKSGHILFGHFRQKADEISGQNIPNPKNRLKQMLEQYHVCLYTGCFFLLFRPKK